MMKKTRDNNLQALRKSRNFKQEEFALKLGVSRNHLSDVETGKKGLSRKLAEKAATILNIPIGSLFDKNTTLDDNFYQRSPQITDSRELFRSLQIVLGKDERQNILFQDLADLDNLFLPKLQEMCKELFADPLREMIIEVRNGKSVDQVLRDFKSQADQMREFAKIASPIVSTMRQSSIREVVNKLTGGSYIRAN